MKFNLKSKKINWMTMVLIGLVGSLVANLILLYGFFAMKKELINQYKYTLSSYDQQFKKCHK
jgi:hypothetical protein